MNKIQVNDKYIDTVIKYLNVLLNLKRGDDPGYCGMCNATREVSEINTRDCNKCPIFSFRQDGITCSNRSTHLRYLNGDRAYSYYVATKESIQNRAQWIADQVNKHTKSDWIIYLKDV